MTRTIRHTFACVLAIAASAVLVRAQQAPGRGGPPPTSRAAAPVDLTGVWVSVISEDWRWRMIRPAKGDYASVPLTAEATGDCGRMGSRKGRGSGRAVPLVRCAGDHARSRTRADFMAGRLHAEGGNGCRHTNPPVSVSTARRPDPQCVSGPTRMAGVFDCKMGTSAWAVHRRPGRWHDGDNTVASGRDQSRFDRVTCERTAYRSAEMPS